MPHHQPKKNEIYPFWALEDQRDFSPNKFRVLCLNLHIDLLVGLRTHTNKIILNSVVFFVGALDFDKQKFIKKTELKSKHLLET